MDSQKIEVGDLVECPRARAYLVVSRIEGGRAYGNWGSSVEEARGLQNHPESSLYFGQAPLHWLVVLEKAKRPEPALSGCTCSSQALFAHGCKCGAVKPYKAVW